MLRMVFGSSHVQMTLQGTLANVSEDFIWAHGATIAEEIKVSLTDASFGFIDSTGLPSGFESLSSIVDELLAIAWPDGTRLTLVAEKGSS